MQIDPIRAPKTPRPALNPGDLLQFDGREYLYLVGRMRGSSSTFLINLNTGEIEPIQNAEQIRKQYRDVTEDFIVKSANIEDQEVRELLKKAYIALGKAAYDSKSEIQEWRDAHDALSQATGWSI